METRTTFQALDQISLSEICGYLRASDVLHLSQTCKSFHETIPTSPYTTVSLFQSLFGRKINKKEMSNLTYTRFQTILKDLFVAKKEPLPFFGFRGNCGCDEDNYDYLFDKVFEAREQRSDVCTEIGENFDIEGVLSEDYAREAKLIQNVISIINETDPAKNPHFHSLKARLEIYGSRAVELYPLGSDSLFAETIKLLKKLRRDLTDYLRNQTDKYQLELPCQKMMKSIGLIQSCHLKREVQGLTCPVKTLVAFASLDEEIGPSSLPSLFSDCKTSDDLIQLLKDHPNELPDINQTSIKKLVESSPNIEYIDEEEDGVEFVVFNSYGKKQDVIPLFWANFNKPIKKDLFLNFKDCNFSGRYVMLKLIQCADLRSRTFHPNPLNNIDMAFCCFYGPVIDL